MRILNRLSLFVPVVAIGVLGSREARVTTLPPAALASSSATSTIDASGRQIASAVISSATHRLAMVDTSTAVTAFINVSVIPMDRERVLSGQTVLVRGGRITAMGPASQVQIPANATQIDGKGGFLIPGLADMHMHLQLYDSVGADNSLLLLLANGVTTIRNVDYLPKGGGFGWAKLDSKHLLRLRARAAASNLMSPRIYTSGDWLGGSAEGAGVDASMGKGGDPEDFAKAIAAYKAAGYDFIKIHDEDPATFDSVVAIAHRVKIPIMGHVPDSVKLEAALKAHYKSIEHLTGYIGYMEQRSGGSDSAALQAIALKTKQAGVWNCPTEALFEAEGLSIDTMVKWPEMRYMKDITILYWRALQNQRLRNGDGKELPLSYRLTKALEDAGAGLLSGTDASTPFLVPGFSLHRELQALVRAGLTPYQALATSTSNVAAYFGTLNESGTVAIGKRADLVLLRGNPLVDIQHTTEIDGVMMGGRWYSRTVLDTSLAGAVGTLNTHVNVPLDALR